MIAPRLGLVGWATAIVFPLSIISAVLPGWRTLALPAIALFVVLAIVDLLWSWRKHRDLKLALPETVRTIAGRNFELPLQVSAPPAHSGEIRIGFALPVQLSVNAGDMVLRLAAGVLPPPIRPDLRADARGVFLVTQLYFDWSSPLGWWVYRERQAVHCEIRVYPNLTAEGRQLATFLKGNEVGIHHYRHLGRGREFEKLREYAPGDGFDTIHWKATAKRRYPIAKVYQVEKAQEVYIALDSSRLSGRMVPNSVSERQRTTTNDSERQRTATNDTPAGLGDRETPALERAIAASLLFCAAAQSQGDLFGLMTFSDRIDHLVKARSGPAHFNRCRDVLAGLGTQLVSPDFGEIAGTLMARIKRRALIVFLTWLDDPVLSETFLSTMDFVARRHLILAVTLLAPSIRPIFSPPEVTKVDDIYQNIGGHLRWRHLAELRRQLLQRGIQLSLVTNQSLSLEVVSQYLRLKRRQAL
jgi:uncharacterized protein (DUF58 family)